MIHDLQCAALALMGDAFQAAAEHANAVAQKRAVGGKVHVRFSGSRVGAQFAAFGHTLLASQAHDPLMNFLGDRRTEHGKGFAEGGEVGRGLGVEVRELPIDQIAAQLAFQIAKAPALQMLEHATTQQAIRGHSGKRRSRGTGGQAVADQLDQLRVVQELVDGVRVNRP